jgi:riboflavin-specific deaminase-like protein
MTVDGKITTREFASVDFTSREDKAHLIRQRALADAVLIGYGTLKQDNVRLGIPRSELRAERVTRGQAPYPLRVVVSNQGQIDPALNLFTADFGPIVIFSTTRMPRRVQKLLRAKATLHLAAAKEVDLDGMLRQLRRDYQVRSVACEGGAQLFRGLLEGALVDQLNLTIAPFLFGGKNAPTLTGIGSAFLPASVRCTLSEMKVVGEECFLTYRIGRRRPV